MRKTLKYIFGLFLIAVLGGCDISGTITQEDGSPVAGITVVLSGPVSMETKTDESGRYAFSRLDIMNGEYTVTPVSEIYMFRPTEQVVPVADQDVDQVDFIAVPTGACLTNDQCEAGYYCAKPAGDCDGAGECTPMPDACLDVWIPVCGCDGKTYSNTCYAAGRGVNVLHDGECEATPGEITDVRSDLERDTTPDVSDDDVASLVGGNTDFALALYQQLIVDADGNIFCSPYSISTALAMLYGGAANETERQMAGCLRFNLPQETLHSGFNYLALELESRGEGAAGMDGGVFRLNVANAQWWQKDYEVLATYLDLLSVNYGAGIHTLDFATYPEPSRLAINQWVAERTEDKIQNLLPQGSVTGNTRLVLTNTIYFNAAWAQPFKESNTVDLPFYLLDGTSVPVPMMNQSSYFGYAEGDTFKAVKIAYDGGELAMVIILPDSGAFTAFEATLDNIFIETLSGAFETKYVTLAMPKWEYRSEFRLKTVLGNMGMTDAFGGAADFSGITGSRGLFVSDVFHQAFIKVNEAGTEAAAATGIPVPDSMPPEPVSFTLERPFIYLIQDIPTGTVLFVGRVLDPAE
jgi:serpin B